MYYGLTRGRIKYWRNSTRKHHKQDNWNLLFYQEANYAVWIAMRSLDLDTLWTSKLYDLCMTSDCNMLLYSSLVLFTCINWFGCYGHTHTGLRHLVNRSVGSFQQTITNAKCKDCALCVPDEAMSFRLPADPAEQWMSHLLLKEGLGYFYELWAGVYCYVIICNLS